MLKLLGGIAHVSLEKCINKLSLKRTYIYI